MPLREPPEAAARPGAPVPVRAPGRVSGPAIRVGRPDRDTGLGFLGVAGATGWPGPASTPRPAGPGLLRVAAGPDRAPARPAHGPLRRVPVPVKNLCRARAVCPAGPG